MTPAEYAEKYRLKPIQAAYEIGMAEGSYRKQLSSSKKTHRNPSAIACRTAQLLDFIRQAGLEPPPPVFFD
jgi:hypothetical protein